MKLDIWTCTKAISINDYAAQEVGGKVITHLTTIM